MQWGKSLSMVAAVVLTGAGVFAMSPADAQPRDDRMDTVYGQRIDPEVPRRLVSYRDLNLATLAGEKTLNTRVRGAVKDVCAESVPSGEFHIVYSCRGYAWRGARPQIARAVMRARELASTGTSAIMPVTITLSALSE